MRLYLNFAQLIGLLDENGGLFRFVSFFCASFCVFPFNFFSLLFLLLLFIYKMINGCCMLVSLIFADSSPFNAFSLLIFFCLILKTAAQRAARWKQAIRKSKWFTKRKKKCLKSIRSIRKERKQGIPKISRQTKNTNQKERKKVRWYSDKRGKSRKSIPLQSIAQCSAKNFTEREREIKKLPISYIHGVYREHRSNSKQKLAVTRPIKPLKMKWFTCNLKLHVTDTNNMHAQINTALDTNWKGKLIKRNSNRHTRTQISVFCFTFLPKQMCISLNTKKNHRHICLSNCCGNLDWLNVVVSEHAYFHTFTYMHTASIALLISILHAFDTDLVDMVFVIRTFKHCAD